MFTIETLYPALTVLGDICVLAAIILNHAGHVRQMKPEDREKLYLYTVREMMFLIAVNVTMAVSCVYPDAFYPVSGTVAYGIIETALLLALVIMFAAEGKALRLPPAFT